MKTILQQIYVERIVAAQQALAEVGFPQTAKALLTELLGQVLVATVVLSGPRDLASAIREVAEFEEAFSESELVLDVVQLRRDQVLVATSTWPLLRRYGYPWRA